MFSGPPDKRFKTEGMDGAPQSDRIHTEPSPVIHVRQLSSKATEADLLEALQSFGYISYVTIFRTKNMALVEFENIASSTKCVQYAQDNAIYVAGNPALFNFSTSKHIQRMGLESEKPNVVLVLHVQNAIYPITVETIHTICKPHGEVRRICILRRAHLQALVEFASVEQAYKTKHALNGADIYSGCCTIKAEFAKPENVRVEMNNQDQWDFVGPPQGDQRAPPRVEPRKSLLGGPGPEQQMGGMGGIPDGGMNMGMGGGMRGPGGGGGFGDQMGGAGGFGNTMGGNRPGGGFVSVGYGQGGGPGGYGAGSGAGMGGGPGSGRSGAGSLLNGSGGGRGGMGMGSGGPGVGMGSPNFGGGMMQGSGPVSYGGNQGMMTGQQGGMGGGFGPQGSGAVAMVYGIDHENWNSDRLFNLLCLYGNVLKIKFMRSKTDTAMVEFGCMDDMHRAIGNLRDITIFEGNFIMRQSKQTEVKEVREPFDLPDGTPSFKNYQKSRNNRFLSQEAAAKNRIVGPAKSLHWFNAPPNMTEEKLKEVFEEADGPSPTSVTLFVTKSERSSTGVAEFEDTKTAVEALIKANHTSLPSPSGRIPYIFKLAFAAERERRHQN